MERLAVIGESFPIGILSPLIEKHPHLQPPVCHRFKSYYRRKMKCHYHDRECVYKITPTEHGNICVCCMLATIAQGITMLVNDKK